MQWTLFRQFHVKSDCFIRRSINFQKRFNATGTPTLRPFSTPGWQAEIITYEWRFPQWHREMSGRKARVHLGGLRLKYHMIFARLPGDWWTFQEDTPRIKGEMNKRDTDIPTLNEHVHGNSYCLIWGGGGGAGVANRAPAVFIMRGPRE